MLADLINGTDVGMVQSRGSLSLASKTLQSLDVLGEFFRQELQGNKALELGVFGLVDNSHPAAAELLDNAIVRNGLADHGPATLQGAILGVRKMVVNVFGQM